MVNTNRLLSETILFVRDDLRANITDPISSTRPSGEKFVMTSYPRRKTTYPIITVRGWITGSRTLGQQSSNLEINIKVEVRIWGRNEKEKNNLCDDVINRMKNNQYGTNSSISADLHDFGLDSAVDVDEEGEEGLKSKVCQYRYKFWTS